MKEVRLKFFRAGPDGCNQPGDVIEVSDKEAKHLLDSHQAVLVERKQVKAQVAESADRNSKSSRDSREQVGQDAEKAVGQGA